MGSLQTGVVEATTINKEDNAGIEEKKSKKSLGFSTAGRTKQEVSHDSSNSKERWSKITPHVQPLYQTSVYDYPDLESLDDYYDGLIPGGYLYSRNGLPNSSELARQVAALENTEAGLVCSSGMASIFVALLANLGKGDHLVASNELYGGTTTLLRDELSRLGVDTTFVDMTPGSMQNLKSAIRENTKMVLVETIANPTMKVYDIAKIADLAHEVRATLLVDNTFATPFLVRPSDLGADIVMHSGTKFLGGHHDITIGVLCGKASLMKRMLQFSTRIGTIAGPFDCWLGTRSIGTWEIRMRRSCENAAKLARYLERHEKDGKVSKVYYPGLLSHPQHALASAMFRDEMFGAMLSFDVDGTLEQASAFVRSLRYVTLSPSLGGVKTTISHPLKTSHRHIPEEQKKATGISDTMIRVSVGVEDYSVIEKDFEQALSKV